MAKEIPEDLKTVKYVRLSNLSISKEQSDFLYANKVSPQKLLEKAINELMKDTE